jgi:protein-S-isoprenylcysteine O-methyltransferase Ste14
LIEEVRMSSRYVSSFILATVVFVAPLALRPSMFVQPEPWLAFAFGLIILLSQPTPDRREMLDRDGADRGSALAIFAGMIAPLLAASIDFVIRGGGGRLAVSMTGALIAVMGLALRLWAIRTLGRFFTSTVRVADDQRVITSGPYGLLRHPSYTGALMTALGTTFLLGSPIGVVLLAVLAIPAYIHRMRVEEEAMAISLGESYREYMLESWRLVPGIY